MGDPRIGGPLGTDWVDALSEKGRAGGVGRRASIAFQALLIGWVAGSAVTWGLEALAGSPRWPDVLFFDLLIGVFAGGAWLVSVLPLAVLGDHDGWFFRPLWAPLVGAGCGIALLLLETWIFFDDTPWSYVTEPISFSEVYLGAVAAVLGATLWTVYTVRVRTLSIVLQEVQESPEQESR